MATITNSLLFAVALLGLFGGFACVIWAGFFGGPDWAGAWAFLGIPVALVAGHLMQEPQP